MRTRTKQSSKRNFAAVIAAAVIASVLSLVAAPASALTPVTITARTTFSGTDRYNTAEKIHTATNAKTAFTDLILVSGDNFPDALAALPLAEKENAGILLLPKDGTMTAAAVAKAAAATHVFIVGGTGALSSAVETKLKTTVGGGGAGKSSAAITRYGGSNRYATAAMVANAITTANVATLNILKTAIVVSGENFADAVSASALVSGPLGVGTTLTHPVLLTQKDSLPVATETSLSNLAIKRVLIIGGTGVVSAAVETTLKASYSVTRIAGTDRFDTAAKVADLAIKSVASGGYGMNKREVYLAELGSAGNGADAIAAGQIVNADGSVLLGLSGGSLPSASSTWLGANPAGATGLTVGIIGGTGVVPTATEAVIKTAAGGDNATLTATISARAGQTTFTVTFSEPILKSSCAVGDVVVISNVTGADAAISACTMTTVPSTSLTGSTAVFTTAALTKNFEVRINAGSVQTADGRKIGLTTGTVSGDTTKPAVTLITAINATGTVITANFSEPVKMVNTLVNGDLKIAGVVNASNLTLKTRLGSAVVSTDGEAIGALVIGDIFNKLIITKATAFSVGTTVQFLAGAVQDLAGNVNTAGTGVVTSDTVVPTVVGNPVVTQAVGACAVYALDNKLLITAKTCGSAGNLLEVIWVATTSGGVTTNSCSAVGNLITIVPTNASGATNTTSTATTMKAAILANASCAALIVPSVIGASGAFTAAIGATAQTSGLFNGGSHTVTVVTTFSESIQAVTGAPAGSIKYDGTADNAGLFLNTALGTTITGANVTTVHSVTNSLQLFVPGTSTVDYTVGVLDVAGNALVAVSKVALTG